MAARCPLLAREPCEGGACVRPGLSETLRIIGPRVTSARVTMLAVVLVATSAALFPPLAPPRPDELLSKVAELVLRPSEGVAGDTSHSEGWGGMPLGSVDGVSVRGRLVHATAPICRSLEMQVGKTSILSVPRQRRIVMQKPSIGSATPFTAADWDNFLNHPLFAAVVATDAQVHPHLA